VPLVTIHYSKTSSEIIPPMLAEIRKEGTRALSCSPSNIWVVFSPVALDHYIQDEEEGKSNLGKSPIVIVRAQTGRSLKQKEDFMVAITCAVAKAFAIPAERVWIQSFF
jgi:phenylpyruvate tautomerase PptA (4-oxalocrotonate tautomerase family)